MRVLDSLVNRVHPGGQRPAYLSHDVEFVHGDVRSREDWIFALRSVDAVIHLAAYQDYMPDFSRFAHVNDAGTALLFEVVVEQGIHLRKVVVGSSQAVYGEGKYFCGAHGLQYPGSRNLTRLRGRLWEVSCPACGDVMEPGWCDERFASPQSVYGASKYAQELYAFTLGRLYEIPTVALRYSIVQGPRQSPFNAYSGVLRIFTQRLLNGLPPIIYEDGHQIRDYVAVDDVVEANLIALERDDIRGEVFNVGGGRSVTVLEYATMLFQLLGTELEPVISGEFRLGDVRHIRSDVSKLEALGWRPRIPLRAAAEQYLEWVKMVPGFSDHSEDALARMRRLGVVRG